MQEDLQLVPPGRLGALLSAQRREHGLDLSTVATRSKGAFDLRELEKIERGDISVSKSEINALAQLYQIQQGKILPGRSHLVIDLNSQTIAAGPHTKIVRSEDEILEQYLSLLYLLRDIKPGSELTLRQPDLLTLEEALRQSIRDIEQELFSLMTQPQIEERTYWLSKALIVPSAGLLVGLTAVGSLVMLSGNNALETPVAPQAAASEILGAAPTISQTDAPSTTIATTIATPAAAPEAAETPAAPVAQNLSPVETGRLAEELIDYDYKPKLPGWSIEYKGDRQGYRGLTFVREKRIEIYVDPGESPFSVAGILAHEIGHAIDVDYLDSADRERWRQARDLPQAWWPGNGLSDFHVGAGDFAEAVAALIAESPSDSHHGEFTQAQLDLARELLP